LPFWVQRSGSTAVVGATDLDRQVGAVAGQPGALDGPDELGAHAFHDHAIRRDDAQAIRQPANLQRPDPGADVQGTQVAFEPEHAAVPGLDIALVHRAHRHGVDSLELTN
jgi:hypothetical protein